MPDEIRQDENLPATVTTRCLPVAMVTPFEGIPGLDPKANLEDVENLQLPEIKIIHEAAKFELPDDSMMAVIECRIIDCHRRNAWWQEKPGEGGSARPDCFSVDATNPHPSSAIPQSESCKDCPKNQWGSDRDGGKGKDCANKRVLHVLMDGFHCPLQITLSPMNLRAWKKFVTDLSATGLPYAAVLTEIVLSKEGDSGREFGATTFHVVENSVCTPEEAELISKVYKTWIAVMRRVDIDLSGGPVPAEEQEQEDEPLGNRF